MSDTGGELQVFHTVQRLLLTATLGLRKKLIFAVLYVFFLRRVVHLGLMSIKGGTSTVVINWSVV